MNLKIHTLFIIALEIHMCYNENSKIIVDL